MKAKELARRLLDMPDMDVYVQTGQKLREIASVEYCSNGVTVVANFPMSQLPEPVIRRAFSWARSEDLCRIVVYELLENGIAAVRDIVETSVDDLLIHADLLKNLDYVVCDDNFEGISYKFGNLRIVRIGGNALDWIKERVLCEV